VVLRGTKAGGDMGFAEMSFTETWEYENTEMPIEEVPAGTIAGTRKEFGERCRRHGHTDSGS
jgi:hypothetical protein